MVKDTVELDMRGTSGLVHLSNACSSSLLLRSLLGWTEGER